MESERLAVCGGERGPILEGDGADGNGAGGRATGIARGDAGGSLEDFDGGQECGGLLGDEGGEDLASAIGGDGEVLGECLVAGATLGIDVEARLDGGAVEGDIHEALAARCVAILDEVEPHAIVSASSEAVEGVVERH